MTLAITDAVPTLSPADMDRALQAAVIDPDCWAERVGEAFDDFWRGRAAVYRIGAIAVPAVRSAAFGGFRLPCKGIRLHPSLLAAIGTLPVAFGRIPDMEQLLELATQIAGELRPPSPQAHTGGNVISFPILRRLAQQWDAADDYTTFPEGPSAA